MAASNNDRPPPSSLDGWDRRPQRIEPLPGQAGLFEYRPSVTVDGRPELFETGRDLPGALESEQRLFWDIDD
jgi:hypothetical protein